MYSGGSGIEADPYLISNALDLYNVRSNLTSYFTQTNDIDMTSYTDWTPIGVDNGGEFTGVFDGNYHKIFNYKSSYGGIFGYTQTGALFQKIRILGASTTTAERSNYGGLINYAENATINDCIATVNITTHGQVAGGLCGYIESSTITKSAGKGNISSYGSVGGFAGAIVTATISNCYARGNVNIVTADYVGGFTSQISGGSVTKCYSTGAVTGTADSNGGFCGRLWSGTATGNHYDSTTSGKSDTTAATPQTTEEMKTQGTFTTWDFATPIWLMDDIKNDGYPNLKWYYDLFSNRFQRIGLGVRLGL